MKKWPMMLFAFAVLATACKKDKDPEPNNQNPVVNVLTLKGQSTSVGRVVAGTQATITYYISGTNLKEAKFDIHSNLDGHTHRIAQAASGFVNFEWDQIMLLGGVNEKVGTIRVNIPLDATPAMYDLGLRVTDNQGNQSVYKVFAFEVVSNANAPEIDLTSHTEGAEIDVSLTACAPFTLQFTASSKAGATLSSVEVVVKSEEAEGHDHRVAHGVTLYDWDKDDFTSETTYNFNESIDMCTGLEVGHYELIIAVVDSEGRVSQQTIEIHAE